MRDILASSPEFDLNQLNKIHIFIVEDQPAITASLVEQIKANPDMHYVGHTEQVEDLFERLEALYSAKQRVDVLVLDLLMRQEPHGTDKLAELTQRFPRTKVLVYSQYNYKNLIEKTSKQGAKGYVDKTFGPAVVIDSIRRVHQGGTVVRTGSTPPAPPIDWQEGPTVKLTDRQKRILECTIAGMTAKEIADKLHVEEETVHYHWGNLRKLFDARTTVELVGKVAPQKAVLGLTDPHPER